MKRISSMRVKVEDAEVINLLSREGETLDARSIYNMFTLKGIVDFSRENGDETLLRNINPSEFKGFRLAYFTDESIRSNYETNMNIPLPDDGPIINIFKLNSSMVTPLINIYNLYKYSWLYTVYKLHYYLRRCILKRCLDLELEKIKKYSIKSNIHYFNKLLVEYINYLFGRINTSTSNGDIYSSPLRSTHYYPNSPHCPEFIKKEMMHLDLNSLFLYMDFLSLKVVEVLFLQDQVINGKMLEDFMKNNGFITTYKTRSLIYDKMDFMQKNGYLLETLKLDIVVDNIMESIMNNKYVYINASVVETNLFGNMDICLEDKGDMEDVMLGVKAFLFEMEIECKQSFTINYELLKDHEEKVNNMFEDAFSEYKRSGALSHFCISLR